jgi:SAM-dependent methyltransferase
VGLLDTLHQRLVLGRRVEVLSRHLAEAIPANCSVLDVGSGDGRIAAAVAGLRRDLSVRGVDVLVRPDTAIPVEKFDGVRLPIADGGVDVVMLVDVLHHTDDPFALLAEAARAARTALVIKDHDSSGLFAHATLRFMDEVGNRRHGVRLPYNYWTVARWRAAFLSLGLRPATWRDRLGLYPFPASVLFDRRLHFVTRLERT